MNQLEEAGKYQLKVYKDMMIKKYFTTNMIGTLAVFENYFGKHLWGHNKTASQCVEAELAWRKIWAECRKEILDKGNNNLRTLMEKELGHGK